MPASTFEAGAAETGSLDAASVAPEAASVEAGSDAASSDAMADVPDAGPTGSVVDRSDPRLHSFEFRADALDPEATEALGTELAFLDTRATPRGLLVVYLHGAGAPTTCGSRVHSELLASYGLHVVDPCYRSDYGVGTCADDIGACRLEAFDGVDRHPAIDITPPNSIETRVIKMLAHLDVVHPGGDWSYFLDEQEELRWERIIISGISHGASSAGIIGMVRRVQRAVMLSGPLDRGQSWLSRTPLTPVARFFGFTHTEDEQHQGHLAAFEDMQLLGAPERVDDAVPPYSGSHRLVSSVATSNGHTAVQAGSSSPTGADGEFVYDPVWRYLYLSPVP